MFYAAGELDSPLIKNALGSVPGLKWGTDKQEPQTVSESKSISLRCSNYFTSLKFCRL